MVHGINNQNEEESIFWQGEVRKKSYEKKRGHRIVRYLFTIESGEQKF